MTAIKRSRVQFTGPAKSVVGFFLQDSLNDSPSYGSLMDFCTRGRIHDHLWHLLLTNQCPQIYCQYFHLRIVLPQGIEDPSHSLSRSLAKTG